ncbi:MAG: hypothetical protein K6C05_04215, partial [Anaerovibrio sp.]|uniref:hypothetical protein n=1 Tax=Anaerovibrio sp. TaxID=1872532 RepID=UPI0025FBF74F
SNTTQHQEKRIVHGDGANGPTGTAKDEKLTAQGKKEETVNILNYNVSALVREPGNYYVEVVPLNSVNSMIRGDKVISNGVWLGSNS